MTPEQVATQRAADLITNLAEQGASLADLVELSTLSIAIGANKAGNPKSIEFVDACRKGAEMIEKGYLGKPESQ